MPSFEVADTEAGAMAGCTVVGVIVHNIVMVVVRMVAHTQVVVVSSCPSLPLQNISSLRE